MLHRSSSIPIWSQGTRQGPQQAPIQGIHDTLRTILQSTPCSIHLWLRVLPILLALWREGLREDVLQHLPSGSAICV